jgi:cytochrome P450
MLFLDSITIKRTQFLNTSVKFLLGVDPTKSLAGAPHSSQNFIDYFHEAMSLTMHRLLLGPLWIFSPKTRYRKVLKANHDYIDYVVDLALEDDTSQQSKQPSLLRGLSSQTSDRIYIRNQIIQGMMASQETTSSLLGNTFFLLSRHTAYWHKLRAAVSTHALRDFDFDMLMNFKIVQHILLESLRLYPIFHLMGRIALTDTTLPVGGGPEHTEPIFIPKGTIVAMNYYALHREASVYGSDVEAFRPERWETIQPTHWEFMGFGGGNRECLGKQKVLVEAAYVLVRMAKRIEKLESRDSEDWEGEVKLTCKSKNGCKVALYREAKA